MNEIVHRRSVGDVSVLTRYLREENQYLDLTGWTVTIRLTRNGVVKVDRTIAVHPDQVTFKGRVDYTPLPADVDTVGRYRVKYIATNGTDTKSFPAGDKQRFYIWIR